jgi:hypothetical protein
MTPPPTVSVQEAQELPKASPEIKKLWNQVFFAKIVVEDKKIVQVTFQEPFQALLRSRGSNKNLLVAWQARARPTDGPARVGCGLGRSAPGSQRSVLTEALV